MGYDIIGDVHGHADKLQTLLARMGYRDHQGAFRHPTRTAIFVGDFIDRGPRQLDSVMTVRRMVDAGQALAIMGNHEFNAISWHTRDPDRENEFLRPRSGERGAKNRHQHEAFLREVEHEPDLHSETIEWFMSLPLWLDLPGLRVVHACWHDTYMNELRPHLTPALQLHPELVVAASRRGTMAFRAVEALLKGLEAALPASQAFNDKDGHARHDVRIRWWKTDAASYRELALLPDDVRQGLPLDAVVPDERCAYDNTKPVFFGHYWMTGQPVLQSPTVACVDYSAGRGGPLVAYRWDGEALLDARHFFGVG